MRYRHLTKQGAHRDAQVPGGYPVWEVGVIVFIKSKIACADPQDSSPRNLTLCVRRRATGKGKGCVLSSAKINLLFRTTVIFHEKTFLFFDLAKGETKTRGLFLDQPLVSLSLPLFLRAPSCYGGKSVAAFSLHSAFVPFPTPQVSAPSHAGTRTRALRTQQVSTFLPSPITRNLLNYCSLGVKTFAFPLSVPEGEGSSPKPSPTKYCCSIICAHQVKR